MSNPALGDPVHDAMTEREWLTRFAFTYNNGNLHAEHVDLRTLAEHVGTPCYVYSTARIVENLRAVQAAFPMAELHYSIKANGNLSLLRLLHTHGAGFDAVSGGEIARAMKAGASPEHIVYAGVGKTEREIRDALHLRIGWFNVESSGELERIAQLASKLNMRPKVALRLNPAVQADTHHHISTGHAGAKFGIAEADAPDLLMHYRAHPHIDIAAIHLHIGSQLGSVQGTQQAVDSVLPLFDEFPDLRALNIGGGFPVSYTGIAMPGPRDFADAVLPSVMPYLNRVENPVGLMIEPGRSVIADAGILLITAEYIKPMADGVVVITDGGMTELIRPALYEALHGVVPIHENVPADRQPEQLTHVVGPICESADVLRTHIMLPPLVPGDLLAISHVGAYGAVMGSNYNARPLAAEVLVDGDQWRVIRRRESVEELTRLEE